MKRLAQIMGGLVVLALPVRADEAALQQRIDQLEKRLAELEGKVAPGDAPASLPQKTAAFLAQTEVNGGAMATWLTDFSKPGPAGTAIPLLGIGTYHHNAFSANLAELTLSNPATPDPEKWDGGFKVSVLMGEDVSGLLDGLDFGGGIGALWEAYVTLNVPVGNGLVVKAGKFATYIGHEVVQPWMNRSITYGFQFALVEPFTHTGVAAETQLNDQFNLMLSVNNGWDQTFETGDGVSFLGRLAFTPTEQTSIGLVGYAGPETGESSELRSGIDLLVTHQCTEQLSAALQFDWGEQEFDSAAPASWVAIGGWLAYDLGERWGLGLRADWLKGNLGLPGTGFSTGITESDLSLSSVTGTVAFRPPVEGLETRLELRYDNTNDESVFAGTNDRVVLALAALYSF